MISTTFSAMITLMLAKFLLNDVPHALGLTEKESNAYITYRMRCPRTEPYICGHEYGVQLLKEPYEGRQEHCPICGHEAPFWEFVKR